MTKTIATVFTCGGGFDVGAKAAGYIPVFGLDNDLKALASYTENFGDHAVCTDIRTYDFTGIKANHLHASPSCKSFSTANSKGGETDFDIDCAKAVCTAINQISPDTFSLENVVPYKKSAAFELIIKYLINHGYNVSHETLNSANYGVPQTRKRLIVLATKQGYPRFPEPTHSKPTQQKTLFELPDWVTWYEAIADLLESLKETDLAPWQQKQIEQSTLFCGQLKSGSKLDTARTSSVENPCFTLPASVYKSLPRIALIEKVGARSDRPIRTISNKFPVPTLKALGQDGHWEQWVIKNGVKVFQSDVRCLARWQSFPDWYKFPESRPVACSLIGNSVPPLLAQRIMEAIA